MISPVGTGMLILAVVIANGLIFYRRARALQIRSPELGSEPTSVARGFLIWCSIPFVVHLVGALFHLSGVSTPPSVVDSLRPFDYFELCMTLFVVARGTVWVFGQNGAQILARSGSVIGPVPQSVIGVKIMWTCFATASIVGNIWHATAM